jgi:hypothetical protein
MEKALALECELLQLEMIQTGYGWRIDYRPSGISDRVIAIGMALLSAVLEGNRGSLDLPDEPLPEDRKGAQEMTGVMTMMF